ncbi:hypothetical protein CORC01_07056 [Colletotrichum orchidophilum]|uniref:Uncharacterized protein n=1 Tax=Colletotrichum orchidophilum TaxID=1209926 RepID=A0A1G4B897_9PEZI|nr:uncharacterized protein CORC01_07056 [Colletotrichum orchidophilum]OHE97641.1 hypothetical protein CORC01_07056 [Colletotrichum orchidophilum]
MLAASPLAWRFFPEGRSRPADVPSSNPSYPPCMRLQLRLQPRQVSCLPCLELPDIGRRKVEKTESKGRTRVTWALMSRAPQAVPALPGWL